MESTSSGSASNANVTEKAEAVQRANEEAELQQKGAHGVVTPQAWSCSDMEVFMSGGKWVKAARERTNADGSRTFQLEGIVLKGHLRCEYSTVPADFLPHLVRPPTKTAAVHLGHDGWSRKVGLQIGQMVAVQLPSCAWSYGIVEKIGIEDHGRDKQIVVCVPDTGKPSRVELKDSDVGSRLDKDSKVRPACRISKDGKQYTKTGELVPPTHWGITLQQVRRFYEDCKMHPKWRHSMSVRELVSDIIRESYTDFQSVALTLLADDESPKEIDRLVSHCWDEIAAEFFEDFFEMASDQRVTEENGFFICFLSVLQGSAIEIQTQVTQCSEEWTSPDVDVTQGCFAVILRALEENKGEVWVIPNDVLKQNGTGLYSRLWCGWEAYNAMRGHVKIRIFRRKNTLQHLFGTVDVQQYSLENGSCGDPKHQSLIDQIGEYQIRTAVQENAGAADGWKEVNAKIKISVLSSFHPSCSSDLEFLHKLLCDDTAHVRDAAKLVVTILEEQLKDIDQEKAVQLLALTTRRSWPFSATLDKEDARDLALEQDLLKLGLLENSRGESSVLEIAKIYVDDTKSDQVKYAAARALHNLTSEYLCRAKSPQKKVSISAPSRTAFFGDFLSSLLSDFSDGGRVHAGSGTEVEV